MVIASGNNPTDIAGPGFVVLSGNGSQNTLSSTNRLNLIGGVLRANNTQIGFGATGGSGMISMRGGVLEIQNGSNGTGSSADFLRPLATTATAGDINWSTSATDQGSGGFSAFGAAASVNLGGSSTPSTVTWNSGGFVGDGYSLMYGSTKSDSTLTFLNPLALDGGTAGTYAAREIKVTQGTGAATDKTSLAGTVTGSSSTDLIKTGTGLLELITSNSYAGNTLIEAGTLRPTNASALGAGSVITSGGTLSSGVSSLSLAGNYTMTSGTLNLTNAVSLSAINPSTLALASAKNFTMTGGTLKLALGNSFSQVTGSGSGTFSILGGTVAFDTTGAGFSYANTYQVASGFNSYSISGLTFSGFDSVNYSAALSNSGLVSFSAIPEPSTWAAIVGGAALVGAAIHRRRSRREG